MSQLTEWIKHKVAPGYKEALVHAAVSAYPIIMEHAEDYSERLAISVLAWAKSKKVPSWVVSWAIAYLYGLTKRYDNAEDFDRKLRKDLGLPPIPQDIHG